MAWVMKRDLQGYRVWTYVQVDSPHDHATVPILSGSARVWPSNAAERELTVQRARARQQYWIEQRDHACAVGDHQSTANAQRFVDEYKVFIATIEPSHPPEPPACELRLVTDFSPNPAA